MFMEIDEVAVEARVPLGHLFADHQCCLKCGKPETEPTADDCVMSHAQYDDLIRRGLEPPWRKKRE